MTSGAAGQLADQRRRLQLACLAYVVPGLAGGFPGLVGANGFGHDGGSDFLVLQVVQPVQQLLGDDGFHSGAHLTVAQTPLGLALKLGILDHGGQDTGEPLPEILTGQVVVLFLQETDPARIIIEALGEGSFETGLVSAALRGVYIVDIREETFREAVGILTRLKVSKNPLR